jgi:hypothetical protein
VIENPPRLSIKADSCKAFKISLNKNHLKILSGSQEANHRNHLPPALAAGTIFSY